MLEPLYTTMESLQKPPLPKILLVHDKIIIIFHDPHDPLCPKSGGATPRLTPLVNVIIRCTPWLMVKRDSIAISVRLTIEPTLVSIPCMISADISICQPFMQIHNMPGDECLKEVGPRPGAET